MLTDSNFSAIAEAAVLKDLESVKKALSAEKLGEMEPEMSGKSGLKGAVWEWDGN